MTLDLLFDSFFFPLLIFTVGIMVGGRIVGTMVGFGTALLLSFVLMLVLPWLVYGAWGIDLITLLAIILFVVLVSRSLIMRLSVVGSITLFLVAILVGGFLLQLLTGSSLAFR